MKVGVGVVTYNRLHCLKNIVEQLQENTTGEFDLFVSDDGSTDGETVPWLEQSGVEFVSEGNKGVVYSKNRVITRFQDYDYIFIVEDDINVFGKGWNELYINAIKESGNQHFNFIPFEVVPDPTKTEPSQIVALDTTQYASCSVASCSRLAGVMMVITRQVVEKCGGLDFRFRGYGFGHCEYTERIHRAGLTHYRYPAVVEAQDYIALLPEPHLLPQEVMWQQIVENKKIAQTCMRDPSVWRPFDVNEPGFLAEHVLK